MATSESSWLTLFPTMSTGMKVQMIQNLPQTLDKTRLFEAMFNLPYNERSKLFRNIPRNTLKQLILSLPKQTQKSYLQIIITAVKANPNTQTTQTSKTTDTNTETETKTQIAQNRDNELKAALHRLHHSNVSGNTRIGIGHSHSYTSDTIHSISDYEDDNDRIYDHCSSHINYGQFKKEKYLANVCKMMRSFGDGPRPSRYCALIVLNHIKSYLKYVMNKMEKSEKNSKKYLDILEKWYPNQVRVFKKWKHFKFQSQKHEIKYEKSNDDSKEEMTESEMRNINLLSDFSIHISDLNIDIGCGARLIESDKFTKKMNKKRYFKFAKCREASLISNKKMFYAWLDKKAYSKMLTYFFAFLAWDRIGCIVQIARHLNGAKHGIIIKGCEFIRPTVIVKAILKVNGNREITPWKFIDRSFDKIDTTHLEKEKKEGVKDSKKRPLTNVSVNDSVNNNENNPNKKRKLK